MIFAIAIKKKIETITILLLFSIANNYAVGQVNEQLFQETESISVCQVDSAKTGVFIFTKEGAYANSVTSKLIQGLTCLETYEDIDTANFEVFLIRITGNGTVCSNKELSLNKIDLPPTFIYDPYRIVLHPSKDKESFLRIWKERVDTIPYKMVGVTSLKSTKTPLLSLKDHHELLKLIRRPDYTKNYEELKKKYDDLKKQLIEQEAVIIDERYKINQILNIKLDNTSNNKK
jgi:hypothetical protein